MKSSMKRILRLPLRVPIGVSKLKKQSSAPEDCKEVLKPKRNTVCTYGFPKRFQVLKSMSALKGFQSGFEFCGFQYETNVVVP